MVAAITAPNGQLVAIHRTWLIVDPVDVWKAPIPDHHGPSGGAKRTLGRYAGGWIRLWRGSTRRPWRLMQPGEIAMVGEGIEDTLGVFPRNRTGAPLCSVSLSSMLVLELSPETDTVVLLRQNDTRGSDADKLLRKVISRWVAEEP
jgi:hypothetical protein